jgi:hypothetical protein
LGDSTSANALRAPTMTTKYQKHDTKVRKTKIKALAIF